MKKSFLVIVMTLVFGFCCAVGLCVRALRLAQTVSAIDGGGRRIVVDAGHGGIDGGVVGRKTGVKESEINLDIAFRLSAVLTEMGFEVTMTRKTDAGLYGTTAPGFKKRDMQRRKEIIQDVSPLFVISVHQNYYPSQSQRGGQVFYGDTHPNGKVLASCVQSKLNDLYTEQGVKNRVESKGDFFMLRCADCPSLIVECGFLSNPQDEGLLSSAAWQEKLARGIASGVAAYLERNAA